MTRELVYLFITKTPTRYRDLNLGPLDQLAVKSILIFE
jgi:hypothetical protein